MIGFLIKKAFFDMWDHLFRIILLNLGFILIVGFAIFAPYLLNMIPGVPQAVMFAISILIALSSVCVFSGAAGCMTRDISDYGEPGFRDFVTYLKETYKASLVFALINSVLVFLLSIIMPFYLQQPSIIGPLAFAFLFWIGLIWLVASQYFFPLQARMDKRIFKNIRKMFLLFFDNTLFSLVVFLGSIIIIALSSFTAFMLPGFAALFLWLNVAMKLRLYKYDYLEEHPEANRRKIPWPALLRTDKERVGKRTLRGMIFPWKE